jgi:pyridoxal phosphate enzyme (YggS family)
MNIADRIIQVTQRINKATAAYHRSQGEVQLLAVSKGRSSEEIKQAYAAGLSDFGESYLQEALIKIKTLTTLPICWHFIGPIQSNKSHSIANNFSWVHSVCRHKIAQQLNDARPTSMARLNICLQINFDDEDTKAGIEPHNAAELASSILQLPRLHLRGLMVIPKPQTDEQQQYLSFLRLTQLLHALNQQLNLSMDTLSMGMSNDLQAAIRAGSTMVRIGTAIFGDRTKGSS